MPRQRIDIVRQAKSCCLSGHWRNGIRKQHHGIWHGICAQQHTSFVLAWKTALNSDLSHCSDHFECRLRHRFAQRHCRRIGITLGCFSRLGFRLISFSSWKTLCATDPLPNWTACTCACSRQRTSPRGSLEKARDHRIPPRDAETEVSIDRRRLAARRLRVPNDEASVYGPQGSAQRARVLTISRG